MAASELSVRPLLDADMDRALEIDNLTFLEGPVSPEMNAASRLLLEVDRTIGLFDGDAQVGVASIYSLRLTVPEARQIPLAGVTWVSVLPTHRRRGGLTKMMRHQLHTLHETGGEAIAGLTATHPAIYGRFGYGLATQTLQLTIPRLHNSMTLPRGTQEVSLRLVDPKSVIETYKEKYARSVLSRPGMIEKPDYWYEFETADLAEMREGGSNLRMVFAERDGALVGYAKYRTKTGDENQVHVLKVGADDPAAYAALWQMLLNVDLTTSTFVQDIAVDDPLFALLDASRYANPIVRDGLYLRLVDVDRALAARTYAAPIDVVFEVVDEFCPWNAGRWRLAGDEKGASCVRTDSAADITVGVRELGSVYLAGFTLRALRAAGLVVEHTVGAVDAASKAFASDLRPWLSVGF
jgi:predicted acetyltransferase